MTDFGRRAAAHASKHQDGGVDEISVAALSGELADNQPGKTHGLGGVKHSTATLAQLNAKVSDATLDKTTDTRTPASHAASHELGQADVIDCTGLGSGLEIVLGADPTDWHFDVNDLTTNGAWQSLNCGALVPEGAKAILVRFLLTDDTVGAFFELRSPDTENNYNVVHQNTQVAAVQANGQAIVFCDSSRIIEYRAQDVSWTSIYIVIMGWFI